MPATGLASPHLRLRPMDAGDEALYVGLYTDPQVMAAILPPLAPAAAARAFATALAHGARDRPGHRHWTILTPAEEALGIVALLREGTRAELGIMLRPQAQGRGIAHEAFALLLPHAFDALGLVLVDAQRADDAHARRIDRLLAPFGFERGPPTRPGCARWLLPRDRWTAAPAPPERLGITPPAG